jgi:chitinase
VQSRKRALVAAVATAALTAGALTALVAAVGTAQADTTAAARPAAAAASSGGVKIAYYDQWSVYGNAYYPKNLDTSGVAGKLNILNYSFENIDPTNLTCFEATKASDSTNESNPNAGDGAGDSFADYQKSFGADISVDGVGDVWNQPIVGNFNQLKKLKAKYPNLKIVASIGGWTYSKFFSDAAATDAGRKKLVSSCIDMFIKGNLPVQGGYGGTGSGAGIFDGFDIDWEYPGSPNGHTGNHYSANDKANYTKLLAEFRTELDAYGAANGGRKMLLTAALPAGQDKIAQIETDKVGQYLDYANIMTYDMHGAWDATGPTNVQDPLYQSPSDPSTAIPPGTEKYSTDHAINAWINGDAAYGIAGGFPSTKITMGYPLYYRGWTGVPAGSSHGLYQSATGPAAARGISQVAGTAYYKELGGIVDNAATTFYDPATQSDYFYNGSEFWTGLGAQSIQAKADYAHCHNLAGSMMYSLLDLDPAATLFNKIVTATNGSASSCSGGTTTGGTTTGGTTTGGTTSGGTTTGGTTTGGTTTGGTTTGGTTTGSTTGGHTCTLPSWSATAIYVNGNQVSWKGHNWKAKWWTTNEEPGTTGEWGVWQDLGAC